MLAAGCRPDDRLSSSDYSALKDVDQQLKRLGRGRERLDLVV
jgi:hypothetical protein